MCTHGRQESNPRLTALETVALPFELRPQVEYRTVRQRPQRSPTEAPEKPQRSPTKPQEKPRDAPAKPRKTKKAATPGGGRAAAETVTASAVSPAHSRGAPLRGSSHAPALEARGPGLGHGGTIESRNMCGQVGAVGGLPHHLDPLSCALPADSTNSRAHTPQ